MDGTLTWNEYVMQTFAMVRDIHKYTYTIGPGYRYVGPLCSSF